MNDPEIDFGTAAIVAAHPDDEILWFASIVAKVSRIILCYGSIAKTSKRALGRRRVIEGYPLDTVSFLDLPIPPATVSGADDGADGALAKRLSAALAGMTTVFTHNPWGEYGQPDHQRVNAAVNRLSEDMKFAVYVSAYVARHQLPQVRQTLAPPVDHVTLPVRIPEIRPIRRLYKVHDCWTWSPVWLWPAREHFLRLNAPRHAERAPLLLFGSRRKRRAETRGLWAKLRHVKTSGRVVSLTGDL